MGQRSFIINVIIGSILIGIAVAANYCQLCQNHVACRPQRGFGAYCGSRRAAVRLNALQRKKILQIHDGLRSLVASGLITGRNGPFPPAKRMGQLRWDPELAKIAAINARQCRVHYDKCRKTERFPWVGQNVGIDRETGHYRTTNQSIYRITLKWFRQFELADAAAMKSYRIPKNPKKRFTNFATMVHDRQTSVGCAAVRFRKRKFYYFYFVCNYSMQALSRRKIYEPGTPYSGCVSGRSGDYPSICAKTERIKAVPYPVARRQTRVSSYVNPLSYFRVRSLLNGSQNRRSNGVQRQSQNVYPNQSRGRINTGGQMQTSRKKTSKRRTRRNNSTAKKKKKKKKKKSNGKSSRKQTDRRNQTEIQNQSNLMFPNPFSFIFG